MASAAPTTSAPVGASPPIDLLSQFEALHGNLDALNAVFRAAGDAMPSLTGNDLDALRLLNCGTALLDFTIENMSATIAAAYSERRS